ncbi:MAG TPA: response regulator, partial [Chloroflexia bacterium]|nr:response regulator [Chloroflexia bacterium]
MKLIPTTGPGLELHPARTSSAQSVKVLLVEANPVLSESVLGHLTATLRVRAGVTHAACLADALTYLRGEQFHTILLDLDLPDGSPPQICEAVRENCGAAVIIVLADSDEDLMSVEALRRGAD